MMPRVEETGRSGRPGLEARRSGSLTACEMPRLTTGSRAWRRRWYNDVAGRDQGSPPRRAGAVGRSETGHGAWRIAADGARDSGECRSRQHGVHTSRQRVRSHPAQKNLADAARGRWPGRTCASMAAARLAMHLGVRALRWPGVPGGKVIDGRTSPRGFNWNHGRGLPTAARPCYYGSGKGPRPWRGSRHARLLSGRPGWCVLAARGDVAGAPLARGAAYGHPPAGDRAI